MVVVRQPSTHKHRGTGGGGKQRKKKLEIRARLSARTARSKKQKIGEKQGCVAFDVPYQTRGTCPHAAQESHAPTKGGENTCLRAQCSKPKAQFLHPHTTTFTNIVHHITPHTSTANLPTSLFHPSPALFPCMVVWSEDGWVTTVATPRASMHASLPSQAVPPHDAEDTVEEREERGWRRSR